MHDYFPILVTHNAMKILHDTAHAAQIKRTIERAMTAAFEGEYLRPRTVIIHNSPLALHIDPGRKLVLVITNEFGFPLVNSALVEELLPFSTLVSLA